MTVTRNQVAESAFNKTAKPPYELRLEDFKLAMQDVYDFYFNGHPDLVVRGKYPNNSIKAGEHGIEIKTTRKAGGAVDTHGARNQWMCVFVYEVDDEPEPRSARRPLRFTEIYLGKVGVSDFRKNPRGELGTRTATLHAEGIAKLRKSWIYRI